MSSRFLCLGYTPAKSDGLHVRRHEKVDGWRKSDYCHYSKSGSVFSPELTFVWREAGCGKYSFFRSGVRFQYSSKTGGRTMWFYGFLILCGIGCWGVLKMH